MEFRDFTVEILAQRAGRFDVRIASRASGELQASVALGRRVDELLAALDGDPAGTRSATTERGFTPDPAAAPDARASDVGQVLFDLLFSEPETSRALAECMTDAKAVGAGVRLKLTLNTRDAGVADLARLPWELLHDDSKYKHFGLRPDFPIVRYLEVPKPFEVGRFSPPLRVLVVAANPRRDLALDRERQNLEAALGDNPDVALSFVDGATIQAIASELSRARAAGAGVHVVHYMGHGDFHNDRGVLLLHTDTGGEDLVEAEAFATALQAAGDVRLVFLNACNTAQSAASGAADPFAGVATSLVFEGIPAVVAMQRPVPDAAAIVLAKHFYSNIAKGWPVDAAVSEGRRQMFFANRAAPDWAIPVLFMRSPDGVLFDLGDRPARAPQAASTVSPAPAAAVEAADLLRLPAQPLVGPPPSSRSRPWTALAAAGVAGAALVVGAVYLLSGSAEPETLQLRAFAPESIAAGQTIDAHVRLADAGGLTIQGDTLASYQLEWTASPTGIVTIAQKPTSRDALDIVAEVRANRPLPPGARLSVTASLKQFNLTDTRPLSVVASDADHRAFLEAYSKALRRRADPSVADAEVARAFADLESARGWVLDHFTVMDAVSQTGKNLTTQDLKDTVTQLTGAVEAIDKAARLTTATAALPERLTAWEDASIRIEAARSMGPAAAAARKALAELGAISSSQATVVRLVTCTKFEFRDGVCVGPTVRVAAGQPVYVQVVWRTPAGMRGSDRLRFAWGTTGPDGAFSQTSELTMDEFFAGRDADRNWWGQFTPALPGAHELRVTSDRQKTFVWREKVTVQ